ncbi:heme NO-binding domain-containing protein [Aliiroseovarius sp.]|uniref:heme NO-binding domain-containing protein n=1 Tax=Aliiroseovarius sp. TaxID=1872442 RepID=UPI00260813A2|nr:heme NO-binding domain-containing protein [Aliiroseovarius sp.]
MHGLINRSLENFLRRTYGNGLWVAVMEDIDCEFESFEPMFVYEDALTNQVLDAASLRLEKTRADLLEDLGTFMVTHESSERVRRLLRFGGVDYEDFLHSLDELPGRARLAVQELELPELELLEHGNGEFTLTVSCRIAGFAHAFIGMMRGLADDYGALALLDYVGRSGGVETISIRLLDTGFQKGRTFNLAAGT